MDSVGFFACIFIQIISLSSLCCIVMGDESKDVDVLARTIWGEARGEGKAGMEAVASVIVNRVDWPHKGSLWWGNTVTEVCKKPGQFSVWNKGDPNRNKILAVTDKDATFKMALNIAREAVARRLRDRTNGATHYYAFKTIKEPVWARDRKPTATIGGHKVYRIGPGGKAKGC